jgi:virginiamycin B lyase
MHRAGRLVVLAALVSGCSTPSPSTIPSAAAPTAPAAATATAPTAATVAPLPTPESTIPLPPTIDLGITNAKAFQILPSPDFALLVNGFLYAAGVGKDIGKIDSNGKQVATWAVPGDTCGALNAGFGAVWTATCASPGLARIDVKTNKLVAIDAGGVMPNPEASIGAGEGAVWMIIEGSPRKLVKVDPTTLKVVGSYDIEGGPTGVRAGLGAVWITDPTVSVIHRFDPLTGEVVADIQVGKQPQFFAVGEGAVWTMNQVDGTISRIDPATNTVVATIQLGEQVEGGDIAVGGGFVWLRGSRTLLFQIEPDTNEVVAVYGPESGSGSVAADNAAIWITAHDISTIWRLPLR